VLVAAATMPPAAAALSISRRENSDITTSSDQLRRRPTRQTGVTAADAESTEAAIPRVAFHCYIRRLMLKRRIESSQPEDP
jgi:hypothetical protein